MMETYQVIKEKGQKEHEKSKQQNQVFEKCKTHLKSRLSIE